MLELRYCMLELRYCMLELRYVGTQVLYVGTKVCWDSGVAHEGLTDLAEVQMEESFCLLQRELLQDSQTIYSSRALAELPPCGPLLVWMTTQANHSVRSLYGLLKLVESAVVLSQTPHHTTPHNTTPGGYSS